MERPSGTLGRKGGLGVRADQHFRSSASVSAASQGGAATPRSGVDPVSTEPSTDYREGFMAFNHARETPSDAPEDFVKGWKAAAEGRNLLLSLGFDDEEVDASLAIVRTKLLMNLQP